MNREVRGQSSVYLNDSLVTVYPVPGPDVLSWVRGWWVRAG